ncbi:MAG: cardiolipin synthase [Chitinophagaceae bacterium]
MNWVLAGEIAYVVLLIIVCLRVIYDTHSNTKTLAYLMVCIFVPFLGMIFYFAFGINYRKRKLYSKKLVEDDEMFRLLKRDITTGTEKLLHENSRTIQVSKELISLLLKDNLSPLTGQNRVKLLVNGDETFPEILKAIGEAKKHIHIEYYIYEDDITGRQIADALIKKAQEGVAVRFVYDDFGSRSIRRKLIPRMKEAGIETYAFYEIIFLFTANRINYRNHRKIIVIDGCTSFVGGINISDRYINNGNKKNKVFWRDTHLRIDGPGTHYLQYIFMCDWNFCSDNKLEFKRDYFCEGPPHDFNTITQIAASGPDSDKPTILYSIMQAISLAQKEILITTPYFIPGDSLMDALAVAALGGVKVKLLVPGLSDSVLVNTAAKSYFEDMLNAGVEIYQYQKGFIHAKTIVVDGLISMVGTANMDFRSFELNFEVNAVIYDNNVASQLRQHFYDDLQSATIVDKQEWNDRPMYKYMLEKIARLLSPLL